MVDRVMSKCQTVDYNDICEPARDLDQRQSLSHIKL